MWDLVVVGSGPAGTSAALAARRARPGASVLLLDRAAFPRDKACGDGIAPHAVDVLRDLGVPWDFPTYRPVRALELLSKAQSVARDMQRDAWVIPRLDFDNHLLNAARDAGVVIEQHRVRTVRRGPFSVVLDEAIEAAVVVAADGAYSGVRRATGDSAGRPGPRALALRGYAPTSPGREGRQIIAFSSIRQPAYAWSFDRGDGWSNIGYGEIPQPRSTRAALTKTLMRENLERLLPGSVAGAEGWRAAPLPLSGTRFAQPEGRILYAGDAAHLVNPLTGEGIYYAVMTGAQAGRVAVQEGPGAGHAYRRRVRQQLRVHLGTTAALSVLARSPGLLKVGLRAAAADQLVFDDLVEVGLGRGTLGPRTLGHVVRQIAG